jgi:hypothetical protein
MPSIWLSALGKDEGAVQKLMIKMKPYGLPVRGHFWVNDNAKMAWHEALNDLRANETGAWAILGSRADFSDETHRYGLAMLALGLQAERGESFPTILLQNGGEPLTADELPTPLQSATILWADAAATPAKIIARLHAKTVVPATAYALTMRGNPHIGQWLEVRPTSETWPGILFGLDQGEILFQAVGPAGGMPAKSVLEHPMQGIRLEHEGQPFVAWALRNALSAEHAYYVKFDGAPGTLLFGPYPENDQVELYKIRLR